MNAKSPKEKLVLQQVLIPILLCIGLFVVLAGLGFGETLTSDPASRQRAAETKTAIAATAGSLLGPFPTATVPTPTASRTPTPTLTSTPTPTNTPTKTPTRFIPTATFTPRTRVPNPLSNTTGIAPSTTTSIAPTNIPAQPTATNEPTTSVPPTQEPATPEPIVTILPPIIQTLLP